MDFKSSPLASLKPELVWKFFFELTQIPRPSKKEEKVREYLRNLAKNNSIDYSEDSLGNIVFRIPATPGYENKPIVVLQGHVDMVCEKNKDVEFDFDNQPINVYIDGNYVKAKGTTLGADYRFTAGMFAKQANEIINKLLQQNKNPIIVGGSGLYIEALIDGLQDSCDYDPILRNRLLRDLQLYGTKFLYNQLEIVDPDYASRISSNDWRRILRALEFYYLAQKTFSSLKKEMTSLHDFVIINIVRERSLLYERINSRVDKMMKEGLIDEVKRILGMGYSKELNSLNTVGYREIIEYLDGKIDLNSAVEKIKKNTRNYAKKQITFFKKFEDRSLNINPDYQRLDFISDILN